MHFVHRNLKAACLLSNYLSLCWMAPCKFVLLRSYGVFAHDVSILYPLQFNWFSVFYACRFYHSAKPFLFRSQFLVSSSPEPADPDESLSVCWPKDHVFFFILTTASVNLLFANGHLTLSSSFFSLKSHYFSSSFPTFQRKSREFSSILSLLAFR